MLELENELQTFIQQMKGTKVFRDYEEQKNKIAQYPDLKRQLDEFRDRNYELQTNGNPATLFDDVDRFQREFEEFRSNPMVNDFLAAELGLCRMVQRITNEIMESISADFDRM